MIRVARNPQFRTFCFSLRTGEHGCEVLVPSAALSAGMPSSKPNAPRNLRACRSADLADKERMTREVDLAFRQAYALCPYSPEAVFRYADLLTKLNRLDDALLLAKTCQKLEPDNGQFTGLAQNLKNMKTTGAR